MSTEAKKVRVRNDKPSHKLNCQMCGKEYMAFRATSKFCSNACKFANHTQPVLESDENQAIELYVSGLTWQEVAGAMNIPKSRMDKIIRSIKTKTNFESRIGKKLDQTGEDNHSWKGGKIKLSGYTSIKAPGHPRGRGGNRGYVMEHILVMEAYIGRYIIFNGRQHPDNEIVHHVNGIRNDNRLENLVLMLSREHSYLHGNQKWARDILDATNNTLYPSLKIASDFSGLNENELATYIHFGWKHNGTLWKYATGQPITARAIELD